MSVLLLGPDGKTWARQAELLLSSQTVAWFIDGPTLIRNHRHLDGVRAAIVCKACGSVPRFRRGLDKRVVFDCCRHGWIDLAKPSEVAPLLQALNWTLMCPNCQEPLVGDNAPSGLVFDVACPCTKRVYHLPAQGLVS